MEELQDAQCFIIEATRLLVGYVSSKLAPPIPFRSKATAKPRNTYSLLKYLFPRTRQSARNRLSRFRHEIVPYYRLRAQSKIYRFIVERQARRQEARASGKTILQLLRRQQSSKRVYHASQVAGKMASPRASGSRDSSVGRQQDDYAPEGRERGARRRKLAGYLKAANELRQSYQQNYAPSWARESEFDDDDQGIPGAFPDVAIVRNGDEEMMLFPSYARRHVAKLPDFEKGEEHEGPGDAESWKKEWERHEDDKAIVDVDVRGWIYSPHRGPMNRKNRLLVGIARRLSGMPAPTGDGASDDQGSTHHERAAARAARKEEELVLREAESITKRGEGEADVAWRGGYSEEPYDSDTKSTSQDHSRASTPGTIEERRPSSLRQSLTTSSIPDNDPSPGHLPKRSSWNQPGDMTDAELRTANSHLMARLKPFLSIPQAHVPITVFFYNSVTSQSRTIMTNEAGHFSVRAALDFVPTDVRVLASEGLSATDEVRITEPSGVSLISDIDDTIKHSAVGSGAREIFRNTFIRDLGDLTIDGVREWYKQMADLGVKIHYVSNSPWQLFPLLSSYFSMAGLPPGSFHLKQYSGMLQGIFEPVAERKKGTLEKIMRDFPERKFLLVGDSGEADLEVYTDVVLSNPGRIVGVFIRDVTTPLSQGFFDSAMGPLNGERQSKEDGVEVQGRKASDEIRPPLPTRPKPNSDSASVPKMGTLIDFDNNLDTDKPLKSPRPQRPAKPLSLQSPFQSYEFSTGNEEQIKTPPPLPPKPLQYSTKEVSKEAPKEVPKEAPKETPLKDSSSTNSTELYPRGSIRQKVASAYYNLPSASSYLYGEPVDQQSGTRRPGSLSEDRTSRSNDYPPPPRRNLTAYPAAAAQYASNRFASGWGPVENRSDDPQTQINKKEDMWKRRWAKAKEVLDDHGVELRSWRVGEDVMDDAIKIVKKAIASQNGEK